MEFVSPKQMARSANYHRPSSGGQRPTLSSAFGAPVKNRDVQISKKQQPASVSPSTVPNIQTVQSRPQTTIATGTPIMVKSQDVRRSPEVVAPANKNSATDISAMFEDINFTEVAQKTISSYALPVEPDTKQKKRTTKRQVFSAAIFVAALVGMVAMGYDLFVSPHEKPAVSRVASKATRVAAPNSVKKDVSLASYTVGPSNPKWLTIPMLDVSVPVADSHDAHDTVQTPSSEDTLEWQVNSATQGEFATVVLAGSAKKGGALAMVSSLRQGATVQLERGDGTRFVYTVQSVEPTNVPPTAAGLGVGTEAKQPQLRLVGVGADASYIVVHLVQQ